MSKSLRPKSSSASAIRKALNDASTRHTTSDASDVEVAQTRKDLYPKVWGNSVSERTKDIVRIAGSSTNGDATRYILGNREWDEGMYRELKGIQDEEVARKQENFVEVRKKEGSKRLW